MTEMRSNFMKELRTALEKEGVPNIQKIIGDYISLYDDTIESGKTDLETIIELGSCEEIAKKFARESELEAIKNKKNDDENLQGALDGLLDEEPKKKEHFTPETKSSTSHKQVKEPKKRIPQRIILLIINIAISMGIPLFILYFFNSIFLNGFLIGNMIIYIGAAIICGIVASLMKSIIRNLHIKNYYSRNE